MVGANFLENLLDGAEVEWKPLGEVTQYEQPTKYLVNSKIYHDNFKLQCLPQGRRLFSATLMKKVASIKHLKDQ